MFADDFLIIARNQREIKEIMENLEMYVKKKKLKVNIENSTREKRGMKKINVNNKERT